MLNCKLRIAVFFVLFLWAGPASAIPFDVFVEAENEEDLLELLNTEQITETEYNNLVDIMQRGVDLNRANRRQLYALPNLTLSDVDAILALRKELGKIEDPAALVKYGALDERKFLAITSFLTVTEATGFTAKGWIEAHSNYTTTDNVPPSALRARVTAFGNLTVGMVGLLNRQGVNEVAYDPLRDSLSAVPHGTHLALPKAYAHWEGQSFEVIAGNYRIGFGERLIFDNTGETLPSGIRFDDSLFRRSELSRSCIESAGELPESPCAGDARYEYWSPDLRTRAGLLGLALGTPKLSMGKGWLSAYAFGSMQPRSVYQYELYDRGQCDDPRDDFDPACSAPDVFNREDGLLAPSTRFTYQQLPRVYREMIGGGHVSYHLDQRTHFGLTGYGAQIDWLVDGIDLDFQEWSAIPYGGNFGAIGASGSFGVGKVTFGAEVGHTFDQTPRGGGLGAVGRVIWTTKKQELEVASRFYEQGFANPFGRPISAPDEFEGNRGRDEAGMRFRYTFNNKKLLIRATTDAWYQLSVKAPKVASELRLEQKIRDDWRVGLWFQYQNKDLQEGGRDECFQVSFEFDNETGETIPCAGSKYRTVLRAQYSPSKKASFTIQARHAMQDDFVSETRLRQDLAAFLMATVRPTKSLRLNGRIRYLTEDWATDDYLEESLWSHLELMYNSTSSGFRLGVRYDLFVWLDDRMSTQARVPSPESRFRLFARYRF